MTFIFKVSTSWKQGIHAPFVPPTIPTLIRKKSTVKKSNTEPEEKKEKRKIDKPKRKTKRMKQPKIGTFFQKK